ncbi:DUF3006 domain-containing protein [Aquibacillus koreensis]|uniref:DUF3006 domain-containing protein n=1 Tax=Aquibacillus koreensis TaxID=279446 RepID=A0A9X3WP24_9BACI|nr:DUF3006 domain-containing protein [Aquibacillus koreensis]MCT2537707.1 DUF3006 domain-containing protein [Aquibacillus koreensis]MDC3420946.1 DUF3006 domain-containing protein [Aquibacillus koreensis]
MKGVLDRIEDGKYAVIIAEEVNKQFVILKDRLPNESQVSDWFDLQVEGDKIIDIQFDQLTTREKEAQIKNTRQRVQRKKTGSKFKRKK